MGSDRLNILEHGQRGRNRLHAGDLHDAVKPFTTHDGVEKDPAQRVAGRFRIRFVEHRHQIVDDVQALATQALRHFVRRRTVARINDVAINGRGTQGCCVVEHVTQIAAIGPAGKQQDVRRCLFKAGDVTTRQLVGKNLRQPRPCRLSGHLADLQGHLRHQADGGDRQPALG